MAVKKENINVQNLLVGGGIILLIIAGYFYFKPKKNQQTTNVSPEEIIVQEEGAVKKTGDEIKPLTEEEVKKIREEVDGVLASASQEAELKPVGSNQAKGQAKKAFSDGKFYLKITASGLQSTEKGCG